MRNMQIDQIPSLSSSIRYSTLWILVEWFKNKEFVETNEAWGLRLYVLDNWTFRISNESFPVVFMGSCCCADSVVSNTELLPQPFPQETGIGSVSSPELLGYLKKNLSSVMWLSLTTSSKHAGEQTQVQTGTHKRVLGASLLQDPTEQSQTGVSCWIWKLYEKKNW